MKKSVLVFVCLFFVCHNVNAWPYFSLSYIGKLLMGIAVATAGKFCESDEPMYKCGVLSFQKPCDLGKPPIVKLYCTYNPHGTLSKGLDMGAHDKETFKKIVAYSKLPECSNSTSKCDPRNDASIRQELEAAKKRYELQRCVEKLPQSAGKDKFYCSVNKEIWPCHDDDEPILESTCEYCPVYKEGRPTTGFDVGLFGISKKFGDLSESKGEEFARRIALLDVSAVSTKFLNKKCNEIK